MEGYSSCILVIFSCLWIATLASPSLDTLEGNLRADINCPATSAVGTGSSAILDNCSAAECMLELNTNYTGRVSVRLGEDHSALSVDVNAVGELNRTLGTHHYVPTTRPYRKGSYYDFSYSVYFPAEDFKNLPGTYGIRITVRDKDDQNIKKYVTEACREFQVTLIGSNSMAMSSSVLIVLFMAAALISG